MSHVTCPKRAKFSAGGISRTLENLVRRSTNKIDFLVLGLVFLWTEIIGLSRIKILTLFMRRKRKYAFFDLLSDVDCV